MTGDRELSVFGGSYSDRRQRTDDIIYLEVAMLSGDRELVVPGGSCWPVSEGRSQRQRLRASFSPRVAIDPTASSPRLREREGGGGGSSNRRAPLAVHLL